MYIMYLYLDLYDSHNRVLKNSLSSKFFPQPTQTQGFLYWDVISLE